MHCHSHPSPPHETPEVLCTLHHGNSEPAPGAGTAVGSGGWGRDGSGFGSGTRAAPGWPGSMSLEVTSSSFLFFIFFFVLTAPVLLGSLPLP